MSGHGEGRAFHISFSLLLISLLFYFFYHSSGLQIGILFFAVNLTPVGFWIVAGYRRRAIKKKLTRIVCSHHARKRGLIFFRAEAIPPRTSVRTLRVFVAVFGLSSVIVRYALKPIYGSYLANPSSEFVVFFFTSVAILGIVPFVLVPAWAFNDAGIRAYDRSNVTVKVPGTRIVNLITGIGVLTSMISLSNTAFGTLYVVGIDMVIVGPFCYLAVVAFMGRISRKLTEELENDADFNSALKNPKNLAEQLALASDNPA